MNNFYALKGLNLAITTSVKNEKQNELSDVLSQMLRCIKTSELPLTIENVNIKYENVELYYY